MRCKLFAHAKVRYGEIFNLEGLEFGLSDSHPADRQTPDGQRSNSERSYRNRSDRRADHGDACQTQRLETAEFFHSVRGGGPAAFRTAGHPGWC